MIEVLSVSPSVPEPSARKLGERGATPHADPDFAALAEQEALREGKDVRLEGDAAPGPVRPETDRRRGFASATLEAGRTAFPNSDVAPTSGLAPASGSSGAEPGALRGSAEGARVAMPQMIDDSARSDAASASQRTTFASSTAPTHVDASPPGAFAETLSAMSRADDRSGALAGDGWRAQRSPPVAQPPEAAEEPPPPANEIRSTRERSPSLTAERPAFLGTEVPGPGSARAVAEVFVTPRRTDAAPAPAATGSEIAAASPELKAQAVATPSPVVGDAERAAAADPRLGAGAAAPSGDGEPDRTATSARPAPPGGGEATPEARSPTGPGEDAGAAKPVASVVTPEVERMPTRPGSSGGLAVEEASGALRADLGAPAAPPAQTTSAASAGLGAPPQGRPVGEAAALRIAAAVDGRGGSVELRLDPPELGLVRVTLSSSEGVAHAIVIAERPETADLLRRHAELLARELAGTGQGRVDVEVSTGGRGGFAREDDAGPEPNATLAVEARPDAATPLRPTASGPVVGLDLRL